jgi:hemoglobin
MNDRKLPLTEPSASRGEPGPARREEIARLVQRFYEVARADDLLGPVFDEHVADWDRHLATMRDFWGTVAYRDGRYAGRPFEAHQPLGGLTTAHFERWLALWDRTVDEVIDSDIADHVKRMARRMAASLSHRLGGGELERAM